ncbi:MAG TPA: glycine oxidase ThiO [Candidatus Methylomirabilis sp.]|nr:glycine oxidase ThiO [Candidatus Methylomirabilis sp.]
MPSISGTEEGLPKSADIVIVGGGVIGCATAFFLTKAGLAPLVLERDQLGCEASGEAAGMLAPQAEADRAGPFLELCLAGRRLFPPLADELKAATGIDIEHRQIGILAPFFGDSDREALLARAGWQRQSGLAAQTLDHREALAAEPLLSNEVEGAICFPKEAHVNSRSLVMALADAAGRHGATFVTGRPVTSVIRDGTKVAGLRCAGDSVRTRTVVIAAGPWSGLLGESLGLPIPVSPAKGELLLVKPEGRLPHRIVYSKQAYLIPTPRGEAILGTTTEFVGYDKRPTLAGVGTILAGVAELVPAIGSATLLRAWAGLRPYTPDELPLIGRSPRIEGLIVATGHHRNGILLGPLTGRLVQELILGMPPSIPLNPFRPDRQMRIPA